MIEKYLLAILAMSSVTGMAQAAIPVFGDENNGVQVYGTLNAAYGKVDHQAGISSQFPTSVNPFSAVPKSVVGSTTGFFSGGTESSRLGAKGNMDFGNNLMGFFTLEEGINITTLMFSNAAAALANGSGNPLTNDAAESSVDNQLFNRQAFVGISYDRLGSVAVGRNYAPIYDIVVNYDPVHAAQLFSILGLSGTVGGGGGVSADTRVEKSLKYTNKIGSFKFGGLYKYSGSVGDRAKSGYGLNAGYEEGNFGVQAAYEAFTDALKGAATAITGDVSVAAYDTSAFMIAARYKFNDAATVKIGYETYTLSSPSDLITSASYYGQNISTLTNNFGAKSIADRTTSVIFIGGDYNFTAKLNLAAGIYDVAGQQSSDYVVNTGTTTAKSGQASSNAHYYALLADYRWTKSLDNYAGVMTCSFSGNAYPSASYYPSNFIVAFGGRFKF
jgi:predicted porin